MLTFGQILTDESFGFSVSDDKRAVTLTFSDFHVHVGGSKSPEPMPTRMFSLALPLEGNEERAEIEFIVQGFIFALEGATATLVCSVNGQTTVADFPEGADESVVQKLKFAAATPSEARLHVVLLLGRDSKNANAEAHLHVNSIDIEILPRPE